MPLSTASGRYVRVAPINQGGMTPGSTTASLAITTTATDGGDQGSDAPSQLSSTATPSADATPVTQVQHAQEPPSVARSGTTGTAAVSTGTSTTAVASTGCATGTVRIVDSGGGSMPPTRVDVEEGKEAEEEEEGRDTHYVSFEGDLSRVVVIDKGLTFRGGSWAAQRRANGMMRCGQHAS